MPTPDLPREECRLTIFALRVGHHAIDSTEWQGCEGEDTGLNVASLKSDTTSNWTNGLDIGCIVHVEWSREELIGIPALARVKILLALECA